MFKEQWALHGLAARAQSQYPVWRYYPWEAGDSIILLISCHPPLQVWRLHGVVFIVFLKLVVSFPPDRQPWQQPDLKPTWIWLKEFGWRTPNQAVRKQPKDEYTSPLPNLCTGALVFLWDVMRLRYDTAWFPPVFELFTHHTDWRSLCGIKSDIWSSHLFSLLLTKVNMTNGAQHLVSGDVACCGQKMMTWTCRCCTYVWSSYCSE